MNTMYVNQMFLKESNREPQNFIDLTLFFLFLFGVIGYPLGKLFNTVNFFIVKDLCLISMCCLIIWKLKGIPKIVLYLGAYGAFINFYSLFVSSGDSLFFLLSLRETLIMPVILMLVGSYFTSLGIEWKVLFYFCLFTTLLSLFFNYSLSDFSWSKVQRMKGIWHKSHEPSIVAGAGILIAAVYSPFFSRFVFSTLFVTAMLLTGSRSSLLAVCVCYFLYLLLNKRSYLKAVAFVSILGICALFFKDLTPRGKGLDYRLSGRTDQYYMAADLMTSTNFLGFGSDRYGAYGKFRKTLFPGEKVSTTTMDSSILKLSLNYGLVFIVPLLLLVLLCFFCLQQSKTSKGVVAGCLIVLYSLIVGTFTGKLCSYPGSIFLFSGIVSVCNSLITSKNNRRNE